MNTTIDLEHSLYNQNIWPTPIRKPHVDTTLGLHFTHISKEQIPFDYRELVVGDVIENEFGDRLRWGGDAYRLYTNDGSAFLANWFCVWTKQITPEREPYLSIIEKLLKECRDQLAMCTLIDKSGQCETLVEKVDDLMGFK